MSSIVWAPEQAFGHGDNPVTCNNRYDSTITSTIINNGTGTFDPVSNRNVTFAADTDDGYTINLTIHTADQSSEGNQLQGTTWYHHNVNGYQWGQCIENVGPDEDIILNFSLNWPPSRGPPRIQQAEWYTIGGITVTYNADWKHYPENDPLTQPLTIIDKPFIEVNTDSGVCFARGVTLAHQQHLEVTSSKYFR